MCKALSDHDLGDVPPANAEDAAGAAMVAKPSTLCSDRARALERFEVDSAARNEAAQAEGGTVTKRPLAQAPRAIGLGRVKTN
jgi:hypothetical protein